MLSNFVFISVTILLGFMAKKLKLVPETSSDGINKYVLNIALPAIILLNVPKLQSYSEVLIPVTIHWVSFGIILFLLWSLKKMLKFDRDVFWTLLVVSSLGNTAFLGIPMVETFFGKESVITAIVYDQLGSGLSFLLIAAVFIPIYLAEKVGSPILILKRLLKFPPFVALIVALLCKGTTFPKEITFLLEKISATLVPMAMFSVGLDFSFRIPKSDILPIACGLGIKLLLVPLMMFAGIRVLGINFDTSVKVSIFQSGMPPMVSAGILAISAGMNRKIAVSLVGLGLIFSFLSLSFIFKLF